MKNYILPFLFSIFVVLTSQATTEINTVSQVPGTLNLQVTWGETDVNLSDPSTSMNKYKLVYKLQGGTSTTIDNISASSRSYTIAGLAVGTYEVELIEVIRVQVPPTPFSPSFVDTENSSASKTGTIVSLNQAPVANCSNRTLSVGNGTNANLWGHQAGEGSTDPNGDELSFSLYPEGPYEVGTHQIELTVSDPEGLSSKCYFTLTVVDNTPPVILAKNAVIIIKANGYAELNIEDIDNGSFDNVSWVEKSISKQLFTCEDVGFHSVTLTVKDESGNSSSQQVTVQVIETIEPYIATGPLTLVADETGQAILTNDIRNMLVTDNCGLQQVIYSKEIFNISNPSDILEVVATDKSGNESAKQISVIVVASGNSSPQGLVSQVKIEDDRAYGVVKSNFEDKTKSLEKYEIGESLNQNSILFTYGPNPVEGLLNIRILRKNLPFYSLHIRDRNGNLIESRMFKTNEISLDLSKLNRGTYFLSVISGNETETTRIELKR